MITFLIWQARVAEPRLNTEEVLNALPRLQEKRSLMEREKGLRKHIKAARAQVHLGATSAVSPGSSSRRRCLGHISAISRSYLGYISAN